ncbi:MAG: matrixin family metalloprotease [Planctomycetota bacterium]|nr:matrixin family metalloprotease [Planctomycetota bacterium]
MHVTARRSILSAAGLAAAALLVLPTQPRAWSALGGTLDLSQRDVRVFNNFTAQSANDNLQADPNFPGALGAPLAIWKGVAEWGSERRNDGEGDPSQPAGIGSGGANFDSTWQGLANGVGGVDDNIVSEIPGSSLGVLAFTETPIQDGWRIRFYRDAAIWQDGPGSFPGLADWKDIQGVMCHEYGHALGLGHSGSSSEWTMFPSAGGTNINKRSVESDDIDGVRALYGVKSLTKPRIDTYTLNGNQVTLRGANFHAASNFVWFTDGSPTADGTPLAVGPVPANGALDEITVTIPVAALAGDVLVRVPGTSGAALSNAFPFDPARPPCPPVLIYGTAKTTSLGAPANLFAQGRAIVGIDDLVIGTSDGIANAPGILFSGGGATAAPFFGGTLLVNRPLRREGSFTFDFLGGVVLPLPVTPQLVGQTRHYQLWFQDSGDPFGVGLSNAVRVTYCP